MEVTAPDGTTWTVGRRWLELPGWRHRGRRGRDGGDLTYIPDLGVDDLGVVGVVLALLVLFFVILNGVALLIGFAALVVAVLGVAARVLFGRPWLVEARSTEGALAWRVRGMRDSRRAVRLVARALATGDREYAPPRSTRVEPEPAAPPG